MIFPPLAVHISDGVLAWPWLLLGFAGAGCLLFWSARGVRDEEIPYIGLVTAAFFVSSLVHVRVGPSSVHLLLNGLAGVILGRRVVLAIAVGLLLHAILLGHGGFSSLGVNVCILSIPALLARPAFMSLMRSHADPSFRFRDGMLAVAWILSPWLALPFGLAVLIAIVAGRRHEMNRDFRAGFVIGALGVVLTAMLNALALVVCGVEDWRIVATIVLVAHIPIAFIEGFIVGGAASFLRRVKPEMLNLPSSTAIVDSDPGALS